MTPRPDGSVPFGAPAIGEDEIAEVVATLRSGWLTTGPRVARFEESFAEHAGTRHAVAVSSCTAGLHLTLVAAGVGAGDEVITTPMTFCATAHAIVHSGARPVFADVEPDTGNIDPAAVEAAIGPRTAAIVPVHLAGRPCAMDRLRALAAAHGLLLLEDAAHGAGAYWRGRHVGSLGDAGAFSFYANKTLVTGEGGMVTTDDDALAGRLRTLAHHGLGETTWSRDRAGGFRHREAVLPGYKANMTDLQAALGIHQLARLGESIARREEVWGRYDEALADLPLELPAPPAADVVHARHLYSPLVETERVGRSRDDVLDALADSGVGCGVHFTPVHLHPWYREELDHREGDFPVAERIGARTISLPLASLTDEDVEFVTGAVRRVVGVVAGVA